MQITGICITYTRRYAYESILGLSSEEDVDGLIHTQPATTQSTPIPKKTAPQLTGWKAHPIHLKTDKGKLLGQLSINRLSAYQTKWTPTANDLGMYMKDDMQLWNAVVQSCQEMGKPVRVLPKPQPPITDMPPSMLESPPEYTE